MKRAVSKFYTLVEIMTVIVIAAILFGIGIPAFTTMIQGSNMTVAIRQLSAKIQAARAYAVTNRCKVALLLMESGIKEDYCYSAYRVCEVDKDNKFQSWIEDENWKTLPKGILRESVSNKELITSIPTTDTDSIGGSSLNSANALVFLENGQLKNATSVIYLGQGRYVKAATPSLIWTERSENKFVTHPIEINKYSGKVKVGIIDGGEFKQIILKDPPSS